MTYDDNDYVTERERNISRAAAIGMHVAFVLLLVFGVAWQKRHEEPTMVVDLWGSMTPPRQEPAPAPKPAPTPKPAPRVEAKPEPKPPPPPPKVEAKPTPKPDIALKDKLEKERKAKEQELEKKREQEIERKKLEEEKKVKLQQEIERRKLEEEKKLKAQQQLEARKKEEEKRKLEKERLAQEAEQKRIAQEQADLKAKLAREAAAARAGAIDKFVQQIQNKVRRNIVEPPNLQGNPEVQFQVRVLPGGEILEDTLRMTRSSGNPAYDQAVERAIRKASPLPVPSDPALFEQFRDLTLRIRPKE